MVEPITKKLAVHVGSESRPVTTQDRARLGKYRVSGSERGKQKAKISGLDNLFQPPD